MSARFRKRVVSDGPACYELTWGYLGGYMGSMVIIQGGTRSLDYSSHTLGMR